MLTAVTCFLAIASVCGSASARQLGGDQHVRQLYQQWEHAASHTSRSLMTLASSPTGSNGQCPATRVWLYKESVCQPEGGKQDTVVVSPNTCVSVDQINTDIEGISAYKYASPPGAKSLQFFTTPDCSGPDKSVGLEGLTAPGGLQDTCPATKGTNPVNGWSYGSFVPLDSVHAELNDVTKDFNKNIKSVWYQCSSTSTS